MELMKEKLAALDEKNKEIAKLKKSLLEESGKFFDEFRKDIFKSYPEITSFSWTQYTPYFNDGDSCTFSANTDYITVNGDSIDDCKWYNENNVTNWGTYDRNLKQYIGKVEVPNPNFDKRKAEATEIILDFLSKFDSDFYESRFGDHVSITVTADGIETDEYEHE